MPVMEMEKITCSISEFIRKIYEKYIYDNLNSIVATLTNLWAGWSMEHPDQLLGPPTLLIYGNCSS
jgi:hypothetical protein